MRKIIFTIIILIFTIGTVYAAERGNAKEAQAMLKKAVAYYNANGQEKAMAEFNNKDSKTFRDRDLYIVSWTMKGLTLAHPNPTLVNRDFWNLKDADGKLLVQEAVQLAAKSNIGELEYKWTDPLTKRPALRHVYYERIGDVLIMCGYFK
jgi:signal transduction histidine kinase